MRIAASHPGKTGDAIYALPTVKFLSKKYGTTVDFYSSSHVERAKDLFEYQSYINEFIVPKEYKIERYDMGIQPIIMPVEKEYDFVAHLGYRYIPDCRLDHFIAKQVGISPSFLEDVYYEYPNFDIDLPKQFYVLPAGGETGYRKTFENFIDISDKPVLELGLKEHKISDKTIDMTGLSFLETCYVMSKSSGFVGLQTNQLVLANGFNIPKVVPHNGRSWDMRHVIYSDNHYYLVDPTAEEILKCLVSEL